MALGGNSDMTGTIRKDFIIDVLKNEFEYKKHWELVGHKTRNLEQEDWKLFILNTVLVR